MLTELKDCPDSQTLVDFLLGKLPSSAIENCREHLADCDPCVETIRGLKMDDDTINNLSRDAWLESANSNGEKSESQVIDELMQRMEGLALHQHVERSTQLAGMNVAEDRAAEVQRLLQSSESELEIGRLGQYSIIELLGAGSTGVVYCAVDNRLKRTVALKILRPSLGESARERFMAEAQATAMLNHPNVVPIFEVGAEGPLAFIAMLWEPGQTLEQRLSEVGNLSVEQSRELGTRLSDALSHAHQRGLIHRDIKPANIWIPSELGVGGAKVLDFGLVRITDEDPQLTCTGMIAGTPCYMSPEQSRGQDLDGRSDLFSLGCVLFQSLTGRLPFRSDNALSTLQSIQRDQPTAPNELDPSIPVDFSDLVLCLLEKSPNRRPPSAQSVAQALNSDRNKWPFEVNLSTPVSKPTQSKPTQPRLKTANRVWKTLATLLAGLAIGAFGFMYGPQITRIVTNQGVVEIDTKVDDVKIEVLRNGERIEVIDLTTKESITLTAGKYEIRPMGKGNSVSIENNELTLKRGGKEIVTIRRTESSPNVATKPKSGSARTQKVPPHYHLGPGDVLGVFVEGVLGRVESSPPVNIPPAGSGMPPSVGYPITIDADGTITLPFVKPIRLAGRTVSEAEAAVARAFRKGPEPILQLDMRIFVCLTMMRDANINPAHKIQSGDVLSIFIEGVLGGFEGNPPIHFPEAGSKQSPSIGFPIVVRENGEVSLPHVKPINVKGMTVTEARAAIKKPYEEGDQPILKPNEARFFVGLMEIANEDVDSNTATEVPETSARADAAESFNEPSNPKLAELHAKFESKQALFEHERIDAMELMETELELLEYKLNKLAAEPQDRGDWLKQVLKIRENQFEHAQLQTEAPPRPGDTTKTRNSSLIEADRARSRLAKSRNRLQRFENDHWLPKSIPVYNGKTYEENLAIARTEWDYDKFIPALNGLANLASELDRGETIEMVMQTVRRGTNLASKEEKIQFQKFRRTFLTSLEPERIAELVVRELKVGNQNSIRAISGDLRYFNESAMNSPEYASRIAATVSQRYEKTQSQIMKNTLWQFFSCFDKFVGCDPADGKAIKKMLDEMFQDPTNFSAGDTDLILIAKHAPESHGFVERLGNAINDNPNRVIKLMEAANSLPTEQSKELFPIVFKQWQAVCQHGFYFNEGPVRYFSKHLPECILVVDDIEALISKYQKSGKSIPDEYLKLVTSIRELEKKSKN